LTEARDEGLDAGGDASLRGDEPCLDKGGSPMLVFCPRFGALSDEAGPQPVHPARSIRLESSARYDCDRGMPSDLFGIKLYV